MSSADAMVPQLELMHHQKIDFILQYTVARTKHAHDRLTANTRTIGQSGKEEHDVLQEVADLTKLADTMNNLVINLIHADIQTFFSNDTVASLLGTFSVYPQISAIFRNIGTGLRFIYTGSAAEYQALIDLLLDAIVHDDDPLFDEDEPAMATMLPRDSIEVLLKKDPAYLVCALLVISGVPTWPA